jgi:hypothetical protein
LLGVGNGTEQASHTEISFFVGLHSERDVSRGCVSFSDVGSDEILDGLARSGFDVRHGSFLLAASLERSKVIVCEVSN